MYTRITKKYIVIVSRPKKDIPRGLRVFVLNNHLEKEMYTDIIKGHSSYEKPYGYKLLKAWINEKQQTTKRIPK